MKKTALEKSGAVSVCRQADVPTAVMLGLVPSIYWFSQKADGYCLA
jgi:hypothetical protein